MPVVREYNTPSLDIRPTEVGVEATAAAARRAGAFYNQGAEASNQQGAAIRDTGQRIASTVRDAGEIAYKSIEHLEISHGAASFAAVQDNLTKQWNETAKNADPNDPSIAAKFREEVLEPTLEKFGTGFMSEGGQRWAESHVDALRTHLFQKTAADMSTLAAQAVAVNMDKTVNRLASTVRTDPSSLDFALNTATSSIDGIAGSSPNISATDAAKARTLLTQDAKEKIVKSAVMGMIEKNPDVDLEKIQKKYGDYISGPEIQMFARAAKTQARADMLVNKQTEVAQRQLDERAAHAAANKNMTDNVSIDPNTNRPIINPDYFKRALDIAKLPNAPDGLARTLLDWGERQQNTKQETIISDPTVRSNLLARIGAGDKPTTEIDILRASADQKLSQRDTTELRNLQQAILKRPDGEAISRDRSTFFKQYAGAIAGVSFDPVLGSPKLYAAEMDARRQEEALRAKGLEPNLVYDPRSEYFFGKPANIERYKGSMDEAMREKPSPVGAKAGEPPAFKPPTDWLFSKSRNQYRDPDGKIYDLSGKPVK